MSLLSFPQTPNLSLGCINFQYSAGINQDYTKWPQDAAALLLPLIERHHTHIFIHAHVLFNNKHRENYLKYYKEI
jgi:hypothetical protein